MISRLSTGTFKCFLRRNSRVLLCRQYSSTVVRSASSDSELRRILNQLGDGKLTPSESEAMIRRQLVLSTSESSPDKILKSFADIDHTRSSRTGFPEAVFGAGKTPDQIALILDDMARHFNEKVTEGDSVFDNSQRAILATRVSPELYANVKSIPLSHGHLVYHSTAKIISMIPSHSTERSIDCEESLPPGKRIVVATAGTTDLPVAEEAAVVLEAAQCKVDRIYDVGVAGLHRVIRALPRLQNSEVGCIIVCAGMDGALPSVVGGLVSCPVIAVPTSIGYGVSLGGISAMLTMLNSCAPGVGVVNIDNGFGAAALAYKCIL
eukprot:CAMPEP_0168192842 /NCGR_PEP_ID=MMETSP0139_2-20121125/18267_1 /TAXON_ID=44445 /ORGANISM="Pseudo-nitzschia australis, Strain 10249 10 AB" /LENGTH=321 /DNA_ID=CAMNT_0008116115 /DNA_START=47 /DNA_END=1015 /DNA_ORIENTATION=-